MIVFEGMLVLVKSNKSIFTTVSKGKRRGTVDFCSTKKHREAISDERHERQDANAEDRLVRLLRELLFILIRH